MQKERRGETGTADSKGGIRRSDPLPPDRIRTKKGMKILFIGCDEVKTTQLVSMLKAEGHYCKSITAGELDRDAQSFMDVAIILGPEAAEDRHAQMEAVMRITQEHANAMVLAVYKKTDESVFVNTVIGERSDAITVDELMGISHQSLEERLESHFTSRQTATTVPAKHVIEAKKRVLVCGCERWMESVEDVASDLAVGFRFENIPTPEGVVREMLASPDGVTVLLGPGKARTATEYGEMAEVVLACKRRMGHARIVGVYDAATEGYEFEYGPNGFKDAFSVTELERIGAERWRNTLDGGHRSLTSMPAPRREPRNSIVCGAITNGAYEVVRGRLQLVDETMSEFARSYAMHQRYTGHMTAMDALLGRLKQHMGTQILDIGCGTGDPMRGVVRNVMIPEYAARPERMRGPTVILSIDSNETMLTQCRQEFEGMKAGMRRRDLTLLNMHFLISDLMSVTPEAVTRTGLDAPDTILASYIIYWADDKRGTMEKFHELLAPGGKLITVEESPLVVTPSPHMPSSLVTKIERDIRVIPLDFYYRTLKEIGFEEAQRGEVSYEIDNQHRMYGKVFVKT
jgi:SAM-dependent methyltransferase